MSDRRNLFNKVWDLHTVGTLPSGQTQLFIGQHLIHEVTSPQAFEMLRDRGLEGSSPGKNSCHRRSHRANGQSGYVHLQDDLAEQMMSAIETNCREFGVTLLEH